MKRTSLFLNALVTRYFTGAILASFVALFILSCSTEPVDAPVQTESEMSIVQILESYGSTGIEANRSSRPTFKTLSVALARTGLAGTVSSNRLTVFAPTDAAFAEYGINQRNVVNVPNLTEILLYHVLGDVVTSDQLSNTFVPTLNGASVEINLDSGVMVNNANVIIADIMARNGVIHAIDDILFPPTNDLVDTALSFDPEFSVLVAAVQKAGLVNTLRNGTYTVFAPTNDAFVALLGELDGYDSLDDFDTPEDIALLTNVLLYHVVDGKVFSSDLSSGPVTTLGGTFDLDLGSLTITDANGREAMLIEDLLNVQASNGVIHVLKRVILP